MPHSFLFTLNILIIYFTYQWFETHTKKYAILTAFFLSLAVNCRPTELVWILVPILWNIRSLGEFKTRLKTIKIHRFDIMAFAITFALICVPQLLYFQFVSNDILKINCHDEKLWWFSPYTWQFLFSYKKGWLLYTPIMIFAIIGFIKLYKINPKLFPALFFLFLANLWITSSWENWWYASSYSQRPMVETYGFMAIPLGYLFQSILKSKLIIRLVFSIFISCVFTLSIFQSRQYYLGIIDPMRMTKGYYWQVFGKLHINLNDSKLLEPFRYTNEFTADTADFTVKPLVINEDFKNHVSKNPPSVSDTASCIEMNSLNNTILVFLQSHSIIATTNYFWLRGSVDVFIPDSSSMDKFKVVIKTEAYIERPIKWVEYKFENRKTIPGNWNKLQFDYITPNFFHKDDNIRIYLEYKGDSKVHVNNLKVETLIPKMDY